MTALMKNQTCVYEDTVLGSRAMKVNHAGEHGAIYIYTGQIMAARLTARDMVAELEAFKAHEMRHRAIFGAELERRGHRRCTCYWLCALGGFALGLGTGLLGRKAIAVTTVAVEGVVLRHLAHQVQLLRGKDGFAVVAIASIIDDERQHHDHAAERAQGGKLWSQVLAPVVAASTEAVIWVGMRA